MIRLRLPVALSMLALITGCRTTKPPVPPPTPAARAALVLSSDLGSVDGAVGAMKGVIFGVDPSLNVIDLTHGVPPYDLWQAAWRLHQTYRFWPVGTVFVTAVDPGVGSGRRSVVLRTKTGHIFVGPDNGLLALVADEAGVDGVRVLDESKSRRLGAESSQTFPARDVLAFVGAQLAGGTLTFEQSGEASSTPLARIPYQPAEMRSGLLHGTIVTLDGAFGNLWTNVPRAMLTAAFPNQKELRVYVAHKNKRVFDGRIPIAPTFSAVPRGQPLIYINSISNLAIASNQDNFARTHQIGAGPEWTVVFSKP